MIQLLLTICKIWFLFVVAFIVVTALAAIFASLRIVVGDVLFMSIGVLGLVAFVVGFFSLSGDIT